MESIRRPRLFVISGLSVLALVAAACSSGSSSTSSGEDSSSSSSSTSSTTTAEVDSSRVTDLVLDPDHDYGDKYADGILPVGDGLLSLTEPAQGYVYLCRETGDGGGAFERGPWFVNDNTEWDVNLKIDVEGDVAWDGEYAMELSDTTRTITTNDLPLEHTTGIFPLQASDPAYAYDRNPNSIAAQSLVFGLNASPEVLDTPSCMGGESGVMNSGVALFNAFDAGNRDASAWEIQDGCHGHPQQTSEYHYHTLSRCTDDISVDTVIGFALDGFPITGPQVGENNILTTSDLDECHGITSTITLDDEQVTTYHYVMTADFPYSVSCFRSTPIDAPRAG